MSLKSTFENTSSHWVHYTEYEYHRDEKSGNLFITPAARSKPLVYDPLKIYEDIVLDAVNIGVMCMKKADESKIKDAILDFVTNYGLLGFMTALPTTPNFTDYQTVYFNKNPIIRDEHVSTEDYISLFFPFEKLDLQANKKSFTWNVNDRDMIALAMTMQDKPLALNMSFQRGYSERYEWIRTQFNDMAFSFYASFLYYLDLGKADEATLSLYRQGMAAFGGTAPTYHIILADKPTMVWDFHSLLLAVQMMFSLMLTDDSKPLRSCKHCSKAFIATHPKAAFCSPQCKNRFNVYKSREKKDRTKS